ncbi:MAG: tryptophan 7-halogenase, partial [Planctomycetaceae bacterium]|nr:tryptophan 7-halogenase [Planctomycetaceae bacterium]
MIRECCDVAVLGAGFAGSLTALLLNRIGRRVVLVDCGTHPRFAIGESSTPLADLTLRRLAEQYSLPRLLPLTRYGDWKRSHPELVCGLKRGFSYFGHRSGEEFSTDERHSRELLVAASSSDADADTHWLRADVDAFFYQEAASDSICCLDRLALEPVSRAPWVWTGQRNGVPVEIQAEFIIDATGPAAPAARAVGARLITAGFETCSRSIFAHVDGLARWEQILAELGIARGDYPFRCDAAAVHHLLDEGWMWQLPFDNGVTSVGLLLTSEQSSLPADEEWSQVVSRYPSLRRQFATSRVVAPEDGWRSTGWLQRRWSVCAGEDWALLPSTAGTIDPLHSTGIAHTLSGVSRLADVLLASSDHRERSSRLAAYSDQIVDELCWIDMLVEGCYASLPNFRLWSAWCMLYFAAATSTEHGRGVTES